MGFDRAWLPIADRPGTGWKANDIKNVHRGSGKELQWCSAVDSANNGELEAVKSDFTGADVTLCRTLLPEEVGSWKLNRPSVRFLPLLFLQ